MSTVPAELAAAIAEAKKRIAPRNVGRVYTRKEKAPKPTHCPETGKPYWPKPGELPKYALDEYAKRPPQRAPARIGENGRSKAWAYPAEVVAGVRVLYESTPGATYGSVAKETGIGQRVITLWSQAQGWKQMPRAMPQINARAAELANQVTVKMSELGKPMSDEVAISEAAKELAEHNAVQLRKAIIERHRKEWTAPRGLAYEAIKTKNLDHAKLAKLAAETLNIVQNGECRAYGITTEDMSADGGTVVVVERAPASTVTPRPTRVPPPAVAASTDDEEDF